MAAEQTEVKSLANINYDCLERIFDFLDSDSLLNVASTCKRLQIAATVKFGFDHGSKQIHLYLDDNLQKVPNEKDVIVDRCACLPFLRCFGSKIKKLYIYNDNQENSQVVMVEQYILEYCIDSLTDILIYKCTPFSNEITGKPFKNVVSISIYDTNMLNHQFANLAKCFPNARELLFCGVNIDEPIDVTFPHLEHMYIDMYVGMAFKKFAKLLHANRQLQSLKLSSCNVSFSEFSNTISENPSITKLLCRYRLDPMTVDTVELMKFAKKHPLMIELLLGNFQLLADDVIVFLGQLKSLKQFTCYTTDRSERDRLINQLTNGWQYKTSCFHDAIIQLNRCS